MTAMQLVKIVLDEMDGMRDEERIEVWDRVRSEYCLYCGGRQPKDKWCQCWNDE